MRVLFAVNNEKISESIIKKYQLDYKEIISAKNVYYFNAIIKELQRNRNYDRIIISEDLEPYSNKNYEMIDKFLFDKLDNISDEASNNTDSEIPIILICTDRRDKGEPLLTKLFSIGIYSALIGSDRTIENLCMLINKPRTKREAKTYYKIFVDDADYRAESAAEVNETEVQNILNHFKKLGKNENAYVTSFNEVASQYTEEQLKLIVGYLPLNVRAVLEEECSAYQKLGLGSVKGKIKEKKEKAVITKNVNVSNRVGGNLDIIDQALKRPRMTKPVVIPSSMDANNVKKVYKTMQNDESIVKPTIVSGKLRQRNITRPPVQEKTIDDIIDLSVGENTTTNTEEIPEVDMLRNVSPQSSTTEIATNIEAVPAVENPVESNRESYVAENIVSNDKASNTIEKMIDNIEEQMPTEGDTPKKRGRGRPPKAKPAISGNDVMAGKDNLQGEVVPKRGRGRPRKVVPQPIVEETPQSEENDINLFDLDATENTNEASPEVNLFGLEDNNTIEDNNSLGSEIDLFGLDTSDNNIQQSDTKKEEDIFNFGEDVEKNEENDKESDINLFDLESDDENKQETSDELDLFNLGNVNDNANRQEPNVNINNNVSDDFYSTQNNIQPNINDNLTRVDNQQRDNNLANLLTSDKKIVALVGTSKNGTSFLVNNVAALMASKGINTAILDLTKNKNAYYIYTQNDETLRMQSSKSVEGLRRGIANGINVGKNLTVYTTLPNEDVGIEDYSNILQTLAQNYSLVILDCDFDTDYNYFAGAQEIYLVQTYDILTIQPLTAFVRELEDKNIINPNKLRIIINKVLKVKNLDEKMIIGGISKYNSPDMTYQKDLFDINNIMYTTIPFEEQTYAKYLEGLVTCNISLNGYSRGLLEALDVLGEMIYPLVSRRQKENKGYNNYNNYNTNKSQFNRNIDSTLNKMRNSF